MFGGPRRRLIINADDFGLAPGVNEGILEAHCAGVVTSASLMVERPAAVQAADLARGEPGLSLGLHFDDRPSDAVRLDDPAWLEGELGRQLELFRALVGRTPTHVDSHHHVHLRAGRLTTFRRLVAALGVPLRGDGRVLYIGDFFGQREDGATDLERISRRALLELVAARSGPGFTELGCHPGRVSAELSSSYTHEREAELETLTSPGLRAAIEELGVTLVSYTAWHQ